MSSVIELLSPAKNIDCGIAAINHGADAVYIGASRFGARAAAGNSLADIEQLCRYAHKYRAHVFVALNTVLTDNQLPEAEKLIHQIYEAGADALIVQDMGVLKLSLPPIALHASTQTDNRTVEKVKFLQNAGFSRVVLARELSLPQIQEISANTQVELEAFVHGALCVSYSGQCYMSEAMSGRSANRGQCAQYCRLPYNLLDANGQMIVENKHLLSLKDLDLSASLPDMMRAGVMSFKIEGRLKDAAYVKNITAYYRKKLDAIIDSDQQYRRASGGKTRFFFEPNPEKSFRRGASDYFLHERHTGLIQPDTPKSVGEPVGKVLRVENQSFVLDGSVKINNGDGLCFVNKSGELEGFRANRADGQRIFPAEKIHLQQGMSLFRNQDQAFEKLLNSKTAERKVAVSMTLEEQNNGYLLKVMSEDGCVVNKLFEAEKQIAQKPENADANVRQQLSKLGNTIYEADQIDIITEQPRFFPASVLADWRRQVIDELDSVREQNYTRETPAKRADTDFPSAQVNYQANITNKLALQFYQEHGVKQADFGFEVKAVPGVPLMFTRYCIKYEMGWCPKTGKKHSYQEPFILSHKGQQFQLTFDCKKCEMQISASK